MRAIIFICLFPGHLQRSSCVGRVQMFCPESGAAVWHCKTYANLSGAAGLWKFTLCCSRGESLAFACRRNCVTDGVSPLQAAAGILLAYENICLKKTKKTTTSLLFGTSSLILISGCSFFFLNILWNTSMLPICSNLVSSGLTAVEERSSLTHLKKLDLLTKIVTEGIHCILLTVQVITPHLTISTWGQNPLCSLWSLRNANPTNLSFHFRSGWSLM